MALDTLSSRLGLDGYGPTVLMVVAAMGLLLWQTIRIKMDPREPALLRPWIPFIGHLIGMLRYHQAYFEKLRFATPHYLCILSFHVTLLKYHCFINSVKYPAPVFTLPMFTSKMYIIAAPELQQVALRSQNLDFNPFIVEFGIRLVGSGPEAAKIFRQVPEDPNEMPFLRAFHKALHEHMVPGPKVQCMNASMLGTMAKEVDGIQDELNDSLYVWLRDIFSVATATAVFGSNNPWAKDRSLIDSFWYVLSSTTYTLTSHVLLIRF